MSALRGLLVAALVVVGLVPSASAPASAAPGTATYVTVNDNFSSRSEFRATTSGWVPREVSVSGDLETGITVRAEQDGPRTGMDLSLNFAAPGARNQGGCICQPGGVSVATAPAPSTGLTGEVPENQVIVLFGATGDLAKRKLLPGIFHLAQVGLMPKAFRIIGAARHAVDAEEFREVDAAGDRGLGPRGYVAGDLGPVRGVAALRRRRRRFRRACRGRGHRPG